MFAALAVAAVAADDPAVTSPEANAPALSAPNGAPAPTLSTIETAPPVLAFPPDAPKPDAPKASTPTAPFSPLVKPEPEEKPEDPNVLKLPKMVVKQKPRPRLTPEIMVTRKAYGEDLVRQKNTQLDQVLNKFTLPLFGTSAAERALDEHEREKRAQLNLDVLNLVKVLETTDPNEAKSLKEAASRP